MPKSGTRGFVTRKDIKLERMPWGPHEWLARADIVDTEQLLVSRVRMRKGQGHTFHRHPNMEEVIYILEGKAEQWIGEEMRILGPGDVAHVPRDVFHATFHHRTGSLRYLMVMGPAKLKGRALIDVSHDQPWVTIRQERGDQESAENGRITRAQVKRVKRSPKSSTADRGQGVKKSSNRER